MSTNNIKNLCISLEALSRIRGSDGLYNDVEVLLRDEIVATDAENKQHAEWRARRHSREDDKETEQGDLP